MGICRDLKSEARIGPGSLPKSPEPLNLWGAAAPGASSITWARDQRRPGRRSRRCCPQAEARVLPPVPVRTCGGGTPAASSGPRACRRFLFSSGWVRARVGWGSRSREGGWGLLEAVWAPQALLAVTPKGLPSPPSLCPSRSGRALLLLLQADGGAPGRPPLLPGLALAAQGVCSLPRLTAPLQLAPLQLLAPRDRSQRPGELGRAPQQCSLCFQRPGPLLALARLMQTAGISRMLVCPGLPLRHSPWWDSGVFVGSKGINSLRFPEAALSVRPWALLLSPSAGSIPACCGESRKRRARLLGGHRAGWWPVWDRHTDRHTDRGASGLEPAPLAPGPPEP